MNARPHAVVMGLNMTGLAVARSLARRGVAVVGLDSERTPASRSRHLSFRRRPPLDHADALGASLAVADALGGRPVLMPVADTHVLFIARHARRLAERFAFLTPAPERLERVVSKRGLAELSEAHDLPLPRTVTMVAGEDAAAAAAGLRFPCVVKPELSFQWTPERLAGLGLAPAKAIAVDDAEGLRSLCERLAPLGGEIVIQEMIVGPDENHLAYQAVIGPEGSVLGELVHRKRRLAPAHNGLAVLATSVRDAEAIRIGRRVLAALDYRGVGSVALKRDARDGRLYLLEVNVRFPLTTGLATAAGVDLPSLYYDACRGQAQPPSPGYVAGRSWTYLLWDFGSMWRTYSRDGTWTWGGWARSLAACRTEAVFARDDPVPFLADVARAARTRSRAG